MANCSDCKYFSAPARLDGDGVLAHCGKDGAICRSNYWCPYYTPRRGEPLGVGLAKYWFISDSRLTPAAIIHDLEYEHLFPGESTEKIDKEFLSNCLKLSGNWKDKAVAYLFFGIARTYGKLRRVNGKRA